MFVDSIRHTLRGLRVARGFTAAALGSISIGIAANITTFSLVNAILLKPLPYTEPDQLVSVRTVGRDGFILGVLGLHILDWRKNVESIESVEAVYTGIKNMRNLDGPGEPERVGAVRVTAKFFDMLGLKPRIGRWFTRAEEDRLAPDVVVISDALWRRHFSADPHILGSRILIEGKAHQVIGITPPDMHFFRGHQFDRLRLMPDHADLFTPVRLRPAELAGTEPNPVYAALARLKRGKTINQARTEIDSRMARLRSEHPEFMELHPIVEPLESTLVGDTRQPLVMLLSAVGLVLLVVCVNVANLLLVRGAGRQRELALRTALGAGRRHLIAQSLTESLLLAVFGTALGTLLASWMIDTVVLRAPLQWARLENTSLDFNVLLFAIGLCFMTAVLFGALPAWRASQAHPLEALKEGGRGSSESPRGRRARNVLVGVEVALTTVLLIGAGLLLASLERILNVPRGFESENLLALDLRLSEATYRTPEQQRSFYRRVLEDVASIPGVLHTGYSEALPLAHKWNTFVVVKEDGGAAKPALWRDAAAGNFATAVKVSSGYFQSLGIPLRAGRLFTDTGESQQVAVASESAARRIWPGQDPIGKRFRHDSDERWTLVIGVVADARAETLGRDPQPTIYIPYFQLAGPDNNLLVRTAVEPTTVTDAIRERVHAVDPKVPITQARTMTAVVSQAVAPRRFQAALVAAFAVLGLLLASIGIWGVVSYAVLQRRTEIGVRLALGASQREICLHVLRGGMQPVVLGLVAGMLMAVALTQLLTSLLFEVSPLDPVTFVAAPIVLSIIAALSCYVPAYRAARLDPVEALRYG